MNTLVDYQNMTRSEVSYNHLVTACLLFNNHLAKVTLRDDSVTCDCMSNKSDRIFTQIYYLKNIHDTIPFDKLTFSGYSNADVDKPAQFIPPDAYFSQLRESLEKEDNTMTAYLMDGLESRLGIESTAGKEYKAERQASMTATPSLI